MGERRPGGDRERVSGMSPMHFGSERTGGPRPIAALVGGTPFGRGVPARAGLVEAKGLRLLFFSVRG